MLAFVTVLAVAAPASARLSESYTYSYDQLWRASVRMIAVDFRFPITERDEDIGFLLFDYVDQGRTYHASIELVRAGEDERAVTVSIQVQQMPTYVERMLLTRLGRKLSGDYGQPPPNRRRAEPTPPVSDEGEGDDDADEDDEGTPSPTP